MSLWKDFIQEEGMIPEWPYPVQYGEEIEVSGDVLVLGGGIAGCHAAINAARKGAKVILVEKGASKRSGSGGAGVDHWQGACTNPCSKVEPADYAEMVINNHAGYDCGPVRYIHCVESWDALLDCERMGMQIRDVNDDFVGAKFRDDETKLMFAYDYENRHTLRVYGNNVKPCLHKEMKRLGVQIYDRVMATSLLTENGKVGGKVVGATGVHERTGAFYIFKAKATVLAIARPSRLGAFSVELKGGASDFYEINNAGDGMAMGWKAGAEFTMMEASGGSTGGFSYIPYGVGYQENTVYGASIVDAEGKEIPWVNRDGEEIEGVDGRFHAAPGQKYMLMGGLVGEGYRNWLAKGATSSGFPSFYETQWNLLVNDLPKRIRSGEYKLPLYSDLTQMPDTERRAIWGLMIGNEGKTHIPVYDTYNKAGFDPARHMLQAPIMQPEAYMSTNWPGGMGVPHYRTFGRGGVVVDWDLSTNLKGLFAAGTAIFGAGAHASAACSGRYAGRKASEYASAGEEPVIDRRQIEQEKERVYAFVHNSKSVGWNELNFAITRIMQDYCGLYKTEETLRLGLNLLKELRENEASTAYAANPHELIRLLECHSLITVGEMVMNASLARKASSVYLGFNRLDYPEVDPPEWHALVALRRDGGSVCVRNIPIDYYLRAPYAPSFDENYKTHV